MLPITTDAVWIEILARRRVFRILEVARDLDDLRGENPELARYLLAVLEALSANLERFGFAERVARSLGLVGMDICLMLYISLRRQAELNQLPPLPRVSEALVDAFAERFEEFMRRSPHEVSRVLQRDPVLLRNVWIMCDIYEGILEREAERERVSPEGLPAVVYAAFSFACWLYELLEEAEEAEEMERLLRR